MKRRILAGILLGLLSLTLSGCWDQVGIAQRETVVILTVAPASAHEFRWTFYFPNPTATTSTLFNVSSQQQLYKASAIAPSLDQAVKAIAVHQARRVYLGQLEDMIVSRNIDAQSLATIVDAYTQRGILPNSAYVVAQPSSDTAPPVTLQDPLPTTYLTQYFNCRTCSPVYLGQEEWQVWNALGTPGVSPVIPFSASPQSIDQLLVYPPSGPPQVLNRTGTVGWGFLTNHTLRDMADIQTPQGQVVVNRLHSHATPQISLNQGKIMVSVKIRVTGAIAQSPPGSMLTPEELTWLESQTSRRIVDRCLTAVDFAQRTHTDPFGWERHYLFAHYRINREYQNRRGMIWPLEVQVSVTTRIGGTGVTT